MVLRTIEQASGKKNIFVWHSVNAGERERQSDKTYKENSKNGEKRQCLCGLSAHTMYTQCVCERDDHTCYDGKGNGLNYCTIVFFAYPATAIINVGVSEQIRFIQFLKVQPSQATSNFSCLI